MKLVEGDGLIMNKSFWDHVGQALANIGKYAALGALWASQHPEVIETVASVAGHPEVAAAVAKAAPVAGAVGAAIQAKVDGQ